MNHQMTVVQVAKVEPLTHAERLYVEMLIVRIGGRRTIRAKRCWWNAQRLLFADAERRLRYWESGLPIPHAWVTINGKVVDVIAEAATRRLKRMGVDNPGDHLHDYRGVIVRRDAVRRGCWGNAVLGETWWTDSEQDAEHRKADEQFQREHADEIAAMRQRLACSKARRNSGTR